MTGTGQDLIRLSLAAAQTQAACLDAQDLAWMSCLVQMNRLETLSPEQRGQSLCRALMAPYPRGFFEALRACGGLKRFLPELDLLFSQALPASGTATAAPNAGEVQLRVLDRLAASRAPLDQRLAGLLHRIGWAQTEGGQWGYRRLLARPGEVAQAALAALCERMHLPEPQLQLQLCRQLMQHRDPLLHLADGEPEAVLQLLLALGQIPHPAPPEPSDPLGQSHPPPPMDTLLHLCQLEHEAVTGRAGARLVQARWWRRMQAALAAVPPPPASPASPASSWPDPGWRQAQLEGLRRVMRHELPLPAPQPPPAT